MTPRVSSIWQAPAPNTILTKIYDIIDNIQKNEAPVPIFFRADDIAQINEPFRRLMQIFLSHQVPLCLAVVPTWLDEQKWMTMQEFDPANQLWCWHQHGWSHANHQVEGKKCEFGKDRSRSEIKDDITNGRKVLTELLGDIFFPVFTPPWNRCSLDTLELLAEYDYKAVSRSQGEKPSAGEILPDYAVNIDLHTRRESDADSGWDNLVQEFKRATDGGCFGIMLHHQLMNEHAFVFLDTLLALLKSQRKLSCVSFRELPKFGLQV